MADIELIPGDYAAVRRLRRHLLRFALALALLLLLAAGARAWLGWRIAADRPVVDSLKQREKSANDRRIQLAALQSQKAEADARLTSLRSLRHAGAWEALFRAIDGAHDPNLWFDGVSYLREVQVDPASLSAPGAAGKSPWALRHGFEIQGHAMAHSTITEFMRALGEQPAIGGVRLAETGIRRYSTVDVVDFKLTGTLDKNRKAAP